MSAWGTRVHAVGRREGTDAARANDNAAVVVDTHHQKGGRVTRACAAEHKNSTIGLYLNIQTMCHLNKLKLGLLQDFCFGLQGGRGLCGNLCSAPGVIRLILLNTLFDELVSFLP